MLIPRHNVLRDPPFSKLGLISCRNLLIYLNPEMQRRLIPIFHYALLDGGYLLLGSSENVTRHPQLFSIADRQHRIFKQKPQPSKKALEFPLVAPTAPSGKPSQTMRIASSGGTPKEAAERLLLERFAPAYVVVDAEGDIRYASARTGKYLELQAGPPTSNIFGMARRGLRLDLRAAVHTASATGRAIVQSDVRVALEAGEQRLNLIVQPIRRDGEEEALCMVIFQDIGGMELLSELEQAETVADAEGATVRQLEANLRATRERLQTTTEELESANEELKSGNEELLSINEELQSSNEELETSKEELQSINEELQTVNSELKVRVDSLSRANSDIANLLEGTQIATIFLDRQFQVKSFTPAIRDIFNLVEADIGRPLSHLRSSLPVDPPQEDAERVLRTLSVVETQVESGDGDKRYIMRMLPYRTTENVIDGVVMTFIDVTRITTAEAEIIRLNS